jgi:hypothetical protein
MMGNCSQSGSIKCSYESTRGSLCTLRVTPAASRVYASFINQQMKTNVRDQTWYNVETLDSQFQSWKPTPYKTIVVYSWIWTCRHQSLIHIPTYPYESICCSNVCETTDVEIMDTSVKTRNSELKSRVFACPAHSSYAP